MRILVVESNTPDMVAGGFACAASFQRVLPALAAEVEIAVAAPYAATFDSSCLQDVDGIAFTGSGVDWCVDDARARPLADAMRAVFERGLPVWGSCNGMQLAAVVLGGRSGASPNGREDGLARDIRLTGAGKSHPMMAGRTDGFAVPCIHRDEVTALPEGSVLLAANAHSPVQAFVHECDGVDFWGSQYHPELTAADVATGIRRMGGSDAQAADLAADLDAAAQDAAAASRVGVAPGELALDARTTELRNWLAHVAECAAHAEVT